MLVSCYLSFEMKFLDLPDELCRSVLRDWLTIQQWRFLLSNSKSTSLFRRILESVVGGPKDQWILQAMDLILRSRIALDDTVWSYRSTLHAMSVFQNLSLSSIEVDIGRLLSDRCKVLNQILINNPMLTTVIIRKFNDQLQKAVLNLQMLTMLKIESDVALNESRLPFLFKVLQNNKDLKYLDWHSAQNWFHWELNGTLGFRFIKGWTPSWLPLLVELSPKANVLYICIRPITIAILQEVIKVIPARLPAWCATAGKLPLDFFVGNEDIFARYQWIDEGKSSIRMFIS